VTRNAAFLAESHWRPDLDSTHLVRLAVATIHETARVRPEVGGPVQVGILDRDGPRLLTAPEVEQVRSAWATANTAAATFLTGS